MEIMFVIATLSVECGYVSVILDLVTADVVDAVRAIVAQEICHGVEQYIKRILPTLLAFKALVMREQRQLDAYLRYREKWTLGPIRQKVHVHPIARMTADDIYIATALEFV